MTRLKLSRDDFISQAAPCPSGHKAAPAMPHQTARPSDPSKAAFLFVTNIPHPTLDPMLSIQPIFVFDPDWGRRLLAFDRCVEKPLTR